MQTKVLVIDDDEEIAHLVGRWLQRKGYEAITAKDGPEGLRLFYKERPDLVILDVMMPEMDGWDVCRRVREVSDVPVIMLTAKAEPTDKITGFDLGADDYVTKPFEFPELLARVGATLRRVEGVRDRGPLVFESGDLVVDFRNREVFLAGRNVRLSPKEYSILSMLLQNSGRVVTHEQILSHVWGPEYVGATGYVKLYIRYLREKLEKDPSHPKLIVTERGVGYRFAKAPASWDT